MQTSRNMETRYIRFGQLPEGGKSWNHMDSRYEAGVSCFRVIRADGKWLIDGAYGSYRALASSGITCYTVAGEEIGVGADGEPLLARAIIVGKSRIHISGDTWLMLPCAVIGATEAIWRHIITGQLWCAFSGAEFRCMGSEVKARLDLFLPQRAASILEALAVNVAI